MRLRPVRPLILRDEIDPTEFYLGYLMGSKSETGNFADHWHAAQFRFTNKVKKQGFGDLGVTVSKSPRCNMGT